MHRCPQRTDPPHAPHAPRRARHTIPAIASHRPPRIRRNSLSLRGCYRVDKPRRHPATARPKVSMSSLTEDTRRRLCSLVAGVVCADDVMTPDERGFLQRVMVRLGVETDTVLMPIYGEDAASELQKLPDSMRRPALELAIVAAAVDGKVVSSERAIVDAMARQVGMGAEEVELRLARALRRPDSGLA